jgi:hypothetical protein
MILVRSSTTNRDVATIEWWLIYGKIWVLYEYLLLSYVTVSLHKIMSLNPDPEMRILPLS